MSKFYRFFLQNRENRELQEPESHLSNFSYFVSTGEEKYEYSQDILDAFELLLQFTSLLDMMDTTCSCNCVECLLNELHKVNLVTEKQAKHLSARR